MKNLNKNNKKKTRNEKVGRPIMQYLNICWKEKNHKLTEFLF